MVRDTQDNEAFSFITLSAATRNVTRYLGLNEQKKDGDDKGGAGDERNKKPIEQAEFVRRRLIDIERFEDRARGQRRK
jgi:hypothetical protein